ncbi:MAG TPA: phosphoribosylformylglycinamidine synthase subunit PurS [Rhodothermales bacterium]|nr:phosphoribosylformylglycinamidine synthase subunit PurS [Rhodothermales bacterium]
MYKAHIVVTLRPSILDPQGKATQHALHSIGHGSVEQVRIGKFIEMWIDAESEQEAREAAEEACRRVLANPVMEDFRIEVERVAEEA